MTTQLIFSTPRFLIIFKSEHWSKKSEVKIEVIQIKYSSIIFIFNILVINLSNFLIRHILNSCLIIQYISYYIWVIWPDYCPLCVYWNIFAHTEHIIIPIHQYTSTYKHLWRHFRFFFFHSIVIMFFNHIS